MKIFLFVILNIHLSFQLPKTLFAIYLIDILNKPSAMTRCYMTSACQVIRCGYQSATVMQQLIELGSAAWESRELPLHHGNLFLKFMSPTDSKITQAFK